MGGLLAALPIVGNLISGLLDCLSGDKKAQAEQALKLLEMAQSEAQAQAETRLRLPAVLHLSAAGGHSSAGSVAQLSHSNTSYAHSGYGPLQCGGPTPPFPPVWTATCGNSCSVCSASEACVALRR